MIKYAVLDREPTDDERIHLGIPPFELVFRMFGLHAKTVDTVLVRPSVDRRRFMIAFDTNPVIPSRLLEEAIITRTTALKISRSEDFQDPMVHDNLLSVFDSAITNGLDVLEDPAIRGFIKENVDDIIHEFGQQTIEQLATNRATEVITMERQTFEREKTRLVDLTKGYHTKDLEAQKIREETSLTRALEMQKKVLITTFVVILLLAIGASLFLGGLFPHGFRF